MANIKIPDLTEATNIQGRDLLILEQETGTNKVEIENLFKGGSGIGISGNEISNEFEQLNNTDLNTVKYNFHGFAANTCTNRPVSSGGGSLDVYVSTSGAYGSQIYTSYLNDSEVYVRTLNNMVWSEWKRISTSPVLLWTNPNLSVAFSGKDITVPSMTKYSFIMIEYRVYKTSTSYCESIIRRANSMANYTMNTLNNKLVGRSATLTSSTVITFSDGRYYETYGTATTYNDGMIPTRVWGVV